MIKTFKIGKHLILKLENGRTNIYVRGKLFRQCKYLLLNLTTEDFKRFKDIESIDEAFEFYNKDHEINKTIIDPETEFIGHCSNLQAWHENNYDLNILHSSLSFPLLQELAREDEMARMVLKEEITIRLQSNNKNTIIYFFNEEYFYYFEIEELEVLFEAIDIEDQSLLKEISHFINVKRIRGKLKKQKPRKILVNYNHFDGVRNERKIL